MKRLPIIVATLVLPLAACASNPSAPAANAYVTAQTSDSATADVRDGLGAAADESVLEYHSPGIRRLNGY